MLCNLLVIDNGEDERENNRNLGYRNGGFRANCLGTDSFIGLRRIFDFGDQRKIECTMECC